MQLFGKILNGNKKTELISEGRLVNKHILLPHDTKTEYFPTNIRLCEDVLKSSSVKHFFFLSFEMSSRGLHDIISRRLVGNILKRSWNMS